MLITRGIEKDISSYQMYQLHIPGHSPYETYILTYYFQLVQLKCTIFSFKIHKYSMYHIIDICKQLRGNV